MVDVVGHLGMALIWLAPAWYFIDSRRTAATFVLAGVWFGMLPDADLYLRRILPTVQHHGVLHTVLAVTLIAAVLGPVLGVLLREWLGDTKWLSPAAVDRAIPLGFLAVWIPALSHLFADMLSAPDIAQPIEPLWPLYQGSVGIDVIWYNSPLANWGLFVVGVVVQAALYAQADGASSSATRG